MSSTVILTIDSQKSSRDTIRAVLAPDGFRVVEAVDATSALEVLNNVTPDAVLLDVNLQGSNGLEVAGQIKERLPHTPIIMITEARDNRVIVQAMRRGIYDYLTKPVNANDLRLAVTQGMEDKRLKDELRVLRSRLEERVTLLSHMGDSPKVRGLVGLLEKIAPTNFTVLIEGESGAGKEMVAKAIHEMSAVASGPFIPVDCGAIPETLFESELFGYSKGAFTGASGSKMGFFEAADKGTLFLDEICNLSYTSQQKLLRAIEERRVQRLGSTTTIPVNVRIISATNRSLEQETEVRQFRVDLLYRLKEVSVRVPPLRERPEDICYLAQRFLSEFKKQLTINCPGFSRHALDAMMSYSWPGNARELRNVVRQAALSCDDNQVILPEFLPFHTPSYHELPLRPFDAFPADTVGKGTFLASTDRYGTYASEAVQSGYKNPAGHGQTGYGARVCENNPTFRRYEASGEDDGLDSPQAYMPTDAELLSQLLTGRSMNDVVKDYSGQLEERLIRQALMEKRGNKVHTAKLLQTDYKTLYRKLKLYGI